MISVKFIIAQAKTIMLLTAAKPIMFQTLNNEMQSKKPTCFIYSGKIHCQ